MQNNPNDIIVIIIETAISGGYTARDYNDIVSKKLILSPEFLRGYKSLCGNLCTSRIIVGTYIEGEYLFETALTLFQLYYKNV